MKALKATKAMTGNLTSTSDQPFTLTERYNHALLRYVFEPGERGLTDAHDLGREALNDGLGILAMAAMHYSGLSAIMARPLTDRQRERALSAAQLFAVESLAPFEMAQRGYAEANRALHRLNEVLEGQARRIASALHDEAAQLLASVHFGLAELALKLPAERVSEIDGVRSLLNQVEERLRNLAHEVRPPVLNNVGLVAALGFLATAAAKRWGLSVKVHGTVDRKLPAAVETAIYRIAQEAVTNVAKHAGSTSATITLWCNAGRIGCSIADTGVGFDHATEAPAQGIGLVEIRERVTALGGTFSLDSNVPHGTVVAVQIPLETEEAS